MFKNVTQIGLAISLLGLTPIAEAQNIHSGFYEGLQLAVSADNQITGYYHESMGAGNSDCSFYLAGKIEHDKATLNTWILDNYPGTLTAGNDGVTLSIPKGREHPGCMNVLMPEIATGIELSKIEPTKWVRLVKISTEKAPLKAQPSVTAKQRGYLVKGDIVGIIDSKENWVHIDYRSEEGKHATGWIMQSEYREIELPSS